MILVISYIFNLLTVSTALNSLWFLLNHIQNTVFKGFLVLAKPVLLPCEIEDLIV